MPPRCLICAQAASLQTGNLCLHCFELMKPRYLCSSHFCQRCGLHLAFDGTDTLCGACLNSPPPFERCLAGTCYNPLSAKLVNDLKHRGQLAAARQISDIMLSGILDHYDSVSNAIEMIIPVPLSVSRLRLRGFNQALSIARPLGRQLGIPLSYRSCSRVVDTASQQTLDVKMRHRNLRHSFSSHSPHTIKGKSIAIVDDVVTTGATASALANCLLEAGAKKCHIWCFARTPSPEQ